MITKTIDIGNIQLMPRWKSGEKMLFTNIRLRLGGLDLSGSGRFSDVSESSYFASAGLRLGKLQLRAYAMGKANERWVPNFSAQIRLGKLYVRGSIIPMSDRGNLSMQLQLFKRHYILFDGFFASGKASRYTISASINLPLRFTVKVRERRPPSETKRVIFK